MKKIITGILRVACFFISDSLMGGTDGLRKLMKGFELSLNGYLPIELCECVSSLIGAVISFTLVYLAISGLYRIGTFNQHIREFDK